MTGLIAGGILGLMLGMGVHRLGLTDRGAAAAAMRLRKRRLTRRVLMMLGWAALMTAFLSYLAVIDVDMLTVLPLHGGTLMGGVIFGAAAGLCGFLPGTALAMTGGGRFLEGLCGAAGCAAGAMLLPGLQGIISRVQGMMVLSADTLFRVTLDEPYLLSGGFLGQGCVGLAFMALALLIPPDKTEPVPETTAPEEIPAVEESISTEAEDVHEDTVIALLPGEEAVVVDTAAPEEEVPPEAESEAPAGEEPEEASADEDKKEETEDHLG